MVFRGMDKKDLEERIIELERELLERQKDLAIFSVKNSQEPIKS